MMVIQKCKKAPKKLDEFRNKYNTSSIERGGLYERFKDECKEGYEELAIQLLKEQNKLCCYCMRKIDSECKKKNFHIEHFKPKDKYSNLALDYRNLLASCNGGHNENKTCGHAKGNRELEYIPNPACCEKGKKDFFERGLIYKINGEISVRDDYFNNEQEKLQAMKDLNEVLRLNDELLVEARKNKYYWFLHKWKDFSSRKQSNKTKCSEFFDRYTKKNGFFDFYGFVKFLFLKKCLDNG
ncbi:MAG: TIGR02646 family protein [Methanobacteriota archaeon]|nr:MAG: TIGR02646 family protein [Euryarchaeota archaeon]